MNKRLLVAAILGGLHSLATANPPSIPSYWVAPPLFNPNNNLGGGSGSGIIVNNGGNNSGGTINIGITVPGFPIFIGPTLGLPGIDTVQPFYPISQLGTAFTPDFQGGTLRIDAPGTYASSFTINGLGGTMDAFGQTSTFTGVFSDAAPGIPGALTIADGVGGGRVTMTGGNSFTGATTINPGAVLALADSGSLSNSQKVAVNGVFDISVTAMGASITSLSGNGAVYLGGQNLTLAHAADNFSGVIGGTGGLIIATGTQTLTGTNTYTGGTTIGGGATLQLGNGGASGGIVGNVADNGSLVFNRFDDVVFAGNITGSGNLIQAGPGALTLTGANAYTGGTTINFGAALQLGNGGASGGIVGNVTDNGSLVFNRSDNVVFAGEISGEGSLTQAGTGTLTLTRIDYYHGVTTINPGATLALASSGYIGYSSKLSNSGAFDISATAAGATLNSLSGNGAVKLGGQTLTLAQAGDTFSGRIEGNGGLTVTGGAETLAGANTYKGKTAIGYNSILWLAGAGSIEKSSGVIAVGAFGISDTLSGATIQTLSGDGVVYLGSKTLTLANASDHFSGTLVGSGGLTVAGGVETLDGLVIHDYAGLTTINPSATLALSGSGIINNNSGVLANGAFDISVLNNASGYIASLSGSGAVHLGKNSLFLANASGQFAGNIDGNAPNPGQVGLVVLAGKQTLSGVNNYNGVTGIDKGATLALAGAGSIAASSGVGLVGSGVFDISAANGGVAINNLMSVASSIIPGTSTVALGANTLTLAHAGASSYYDPFYAGNITGTGGLAIAGGALTLTGTNTYTGLTTINRGATLALAGNGSIAQSSGVADYGVFDIAGTNAGATIQSLSGDGVVVLGSRPLTIINAQDSFTGSFIGDGNNTMSLLGGSQTLAGHISLGRFLVQGGTLRINGILDGMVDVGKGGALRGTGAINGLVNVAGTLAPGNSPGTLTANATVSMAPGSVYQEDIDGRGNGNGAGNYSRLLVNGASSQFIANGSLQPLLRGITGSAGNNFTPSLGDGFRIITAEGGIVGRFANIVQPLGLSTGTQLDVFYNTYNNHSIDLFTTPTSYLGYLAAAGLNDNGQAVGRSLDRMRNLDAAGQASTQRNQLRYSVAGLSSGQLPQVALNLAGEVHAAMAAAAPEAGRWLQTSVARQLAFSVGGQEADELTAGNSLWVDFNASQGHSDSDASSTGYSSSRYQFAVGVDLLHEQTNRLGIGATYASTSISPTSGSGKIEETAPFLYGQYAFGQSQKLILDGLFSYGFSTWQTDRADPIARTAGLHSNASGNSTLFSVGIRSPFAFDGFALEPFARVLWQNNNRGGFNEGIATPSALALSNYSMNGTRTLVGLAVGSQQANPLASDYTYRASLAFGNDFGDLVHPSVQAYLAGDSMAINSPHVGRQFGQLNLSATYRFFDNAYAYVGLNGEARSDRLDGGVNAGLNIKF